MSLSPLRRRWQSNDRNVRLQLINAGLLGFTLDGGISTVIFNLYLLRLGFGPQQVGLINSAGMFAFAVASLPAGRLGERWNLRRMLVLGMMLCLLGATMTPFSDLLPSQWRLGWIILAYALVNLGMACYYVNASPYMVGRTAPELRASVFAMQSAMYAVFGFAGSLAGGGMPKLMTLWLGGTLEDAAPYRWPLLLGVFVLLAAFRLTLMLQEGAGVETQAARAPAGAPSVIQSAIGLIALMSVIRFLQVGGAGSVTTFFNVYMDDHLHVPTATIGIILALAKLTGVPAALAVPSLTRRFGNGPVVTWASLAVVFCLAPLAFIPLWPVAGLSYIGAWLSTPVRYSAFMVYIMEHSPPHLRGSMSGAGEMAAGFSFALIAWSGGYLITAFGYPTLFLCGAGLTLLGTVLFWGYMRWGERIFH
jgi:MFS family permease